MKKYFLAFYFVYALQSLSLYGDLFPTQHEPQLVVNNRVIVRVNGKSITVMDVMKRMDIHFLKQYPEYTSFALARYQFYETQWRAVLDELISKELVLADAEENKITVSSGDIRQEMEQYFGPNIIENLDKIGLSYEEAYKMLEGELIVRRMIFMRVNNKVFGKLTPQAIKEAYEEYAKDNVRKETWRYQVISVKSSDASISEALANSIYQILSNPETTISLSELKEKLIEEKRGTVTVSDELTHAESDMAPLVKEQILKLSAGMYSKPFSQKSRADSSIVHRILHLKEKTPGGAVPFSEVELTIKDNLMEKGMTEEYTAYLKRLRQHFDVKETLENDLVQADFQPFALKT